MGPAIYIMWLRQMKRFLRSKARIVALLAQPLLFLVTFGFGFSAAVRTTVFLADMNDFAAMNEVYGKYFSTAPPARSTVEVARLPKDVLVEIDVIALA